MVLALNYWLINEYDVPSRSDYYIIQLTHLVASMLSSDKIDISKFIIPFNKPKTLKTDAQKKQDKAEYKKNLALLTKYQMSAGKASTVSRGNIFEDEKNGVRKRNFAAARTPEGRLLTV